MPEDQRAKAARYRDSAAALRDAASGLQFDPRRRNQLLALAEGFDQAAERLEKQETFKSSLTIPRHTRRVTDG